MLAEGNVYLKVAKPYFAEPEAAVFPEFDPSISLISENEIVYLEMNIDSLITESCQTLITTTRLGTTMFVNAPFMNPDGSKIEITTDYTGAKRNPGSPSADPFEKPGIGRIKIKVW